MIRKALIEAREKRGWSRGKAALALEIDATTLYRWEQGKSMPQGHKKHRLCEVYGANPWDLGLEGIAIEEDEAIAMPGSGLLETRLLTAILQWPRNTLDYGALRTKLRKEIEESMANEVSRRRALEILATLPISVFGMSPVKAAITVAAEELMPWCASGIVACWSLGRGNDLMLASSLVSSYIPTLSMLVEQPRYRQIAAGLVAQAYLLRATLGWHIETLNDALNYALQAEKYSKISKDFTLQVDALHRLGMVHYYSKRYDQSLLKLKEAKEIMEHHDIPRTVARHAYLDLATYQAKVGKGSDTKISLKQAHRLFSAESDDPTAIMLGYENISDALRWEGLAMSHLGYHSEALDSYRQIENQRLPTAERIRVELLCNQLHSKMRLKDKDLEECVALWLDAINGAKALQSEQRYSEALLLYETMECVWPGEQRIAELKEHLAHW